MNIEKIIGVLFFALLAASGMFCIYIMFVIMPVSLYAESECLKKGYPKAHVTVGLEQYCSTLDGAVTVKISKLSK